jgi:hypothetical protein
MVVVHRGGKLVGTSTSRSSVALRPYGPLRIA